MQHWDCLQNERKQHPNTQQKHQRTHFDLYTVPEILDQRQSMHLRKKKKEIKKKGKKEKTKPHSIPKRIFLHTRFGAGILSRRSCMEGRRESETWQSIQESEPGNQVLLLHKRRETTSLGAGPTAFFCLFRNKHTKLCFFYHKNAVFRSQSDNLIDFL